MILFAQSYLSDTTDYLDISGLFVLFMYVSKQQRLAELSPKKVRYS